MSNRVEVEGATVCKTFGSSARGEHLREVAALRLLQQAAPGLAPVLRQADLTARPPVVRMSLLAGRPVRVDDVTGPVVRAMADSLARMHGAVPTAALRALPWSLGSGEVLWPRVRELWVGMRGRPDSGPARRIGSWLASVRAGAIHSRDVVLGRGDHNLPNFLLDGDRVRLLDFEDGGRSDRMMELAQWREHVAAEDVPQSVWDGVMTPATPQEAQRLLTYQRLVAVYWFLLLARGTWPSPADARLRRRLARVERLLA